MEAELMMPRRQVYYPQKQQLAGFYSALSKFNFGLVLIQLEIVLYFFFTDIEDFNDGLLGYAMLAVGLVYHSPFRPFILGFGYIAEVIAVATVGITGFFLALVFNEEAEGEITDRFELWLTSFALPFLIALTLIPLIAFSKSEKKSLETQNYQIAHISQENLLNIEQV
eukprot:CAMPEP_0205818290 /NCGR_PEP_ID=MMETSP0206-20130828/114_1 /ASSEMBLY_ACC=CAM_ASM_000279 /TAXON_ID=36767 /ORGANISM="Euplotes focardii, Strain TN1" /LENGTH=167 /DNA_ID=CAMNT_0053110535 /DNA_START=41 /DNA_END=544 /DNA_ORIENTATION=+